MVCLIKSKYKDELAEYKRILGSEEAAYYALAANNGNTLDEDPLGNHSGLYDDLIASGLSHEEAILQKILAYMPLFTDKYGDWISENRSEPTIADLNNGKSDYSNLSINKIIKDKNIDKVLKDAEANHQVFLRNDIITDALADSRKKWVDQQVAKYIQMRSNPTGADIYGYRLAAQVDWNEKKISEIIGEQLQLIAKAFGLKKVKRPDGSFVYMSSDDSQESKLRIAFVNSITLGEFEDQNGVKHKGLFNEQSVHMEAAWNAIYISIEDGDAETFVHEMVHYYVRTFWNTSIVQEALKEISGKVTKSENSLEYSKRLEEALVKEIVDRTTLKQSKVKSFWNGINSILKVLGKDLNKDKVVSNNILDTITAAFAVNKDLSNSISDIILYEKYLGTVFDDPITPSSELEDLEGSTFILIQQTLESRRKSEKARRNINNNDLLNVEEKLKAIERRSKSDRGDVKETVEDFLILADQDIMRAIRFLINLNERGDEAIFNLDANDLMHLKYDVIGYYNSMIGKDIRKYINESDYLSDNDKNNKRQLIANISRNIADAKRLFDDILSKYIDHQLDMYADELVAIGDKDIFKANLKHWVRNAIDDGDLMPLENALGPAVNSRSPIVRLIEYLITDQNRVTFVESQRVGHELLDRYKKSSSLLKKLTKANFAKTFLDLDDNGDPTGYFARKYRYGKLYKMRDDIKKKLAKKYNIQQDPNTGEYKFESKEQRINYTRDFYNQMDKIANFRYKKEYYIKRAELLSEEALSKEESILSEINILILKSIDKELNIPLIFNLTSEEQDRLNRLQEEKENLHSPYIIVKDNSGNIIHFLEKSGKELEIAKEFMEWDAYKNKHFKYKSNWDKFDQVRQHLVDKYGENSYQVKMLDYKYKTRRISPKFYEELPENNDPVLAELYARRAFIRNSIIKKKKYGFHPNLRRLNEQAFAELKAIDQKIADIYKDNSSNGVKLDKHKVWVNLYDTEGNITTDIAYNYFSDLERIQRLTRGVNTLDESLYTYVDAKGWTQPLSIFSFTAPNDESMVEDVLLGEFSEVDPTSDIVNPKFDENEKEELQPKHTEEFINKNWEKIQNDKNLIEIIDDNGKTIKVPKLKYFYDYLLSVMREAYSNLPNMDPERMLYVMPQMRDRDVKLLFRNRHILNNMGASIADAISITERLTEYNEDFSTRPDGSEISTIPIRWINRLEDPSIISTDIVQSVMMFYEMSLNYKNKSELNPMLQAMLFMTLGGFSEQSKESDMSDQAQRIQTLMLMYVYGRMRTGAFSKKTRKLSNKERVYARIVDTVLSKAHAKLMNHNWRAILKNFVDSFLTETGEILCGKYITVTDALFANKEMGMEVFSSVNSFGKANVKSKIAALMQLNGCSGTISEIFGQHNETWLRRVISKHFSMGEYTLVDYTFKGHYITSLYHSIRMVLNPKTKKYEFMNKDQAMYHYQSAGLGMKEGLKQWKKSKVTLWDAYDVDDKGNAFVKDEVIPGTGNIKYDDLVYPYVESIGRKSRRLVNQVSGTIRERSSIINGVLDKSGGAALKQSSIGAMVLQMRGWMLSQMWDNLKNGNDFAEYQKQWRTMFEQLAQNNDNGGFYIGRKKRKPNKNLNKYTAKKEESSTENKTISEKVNSYFDIGINIDPELEGQYNFETGTVETGQWRGLGRAAFHGFADFLNRTIDAYKNIRNIENSQEYQRRLTRNERYKLRRLSTMAATFMILCACTYFTSLAVAKWPEKWYLHLLSAVNVSAISERASQLPVFAWASILDIVNSIIISKTLIEDADKIVQALKDLLELTEDKVFGVEDLHYADPVKGGAYDKMPKIYRDWLKVASYTDYNIDNVFRSVLPSGNKASINYYIQNVSPTKQAYEMSMFFVPWSLSLVGVDIDDSELYEKKKKSKSKKKEIDSF